MLDSLNEVVLGLAPFSDALESFFLVGAVLFDRVDSVEHEAHASRERGPGVGGDGDGRRSGLGGGVWFDREDMRAEEEKRALVGSGDSSEDEEGERCFRHEKREGERELKPWINPMRETEMYALRSQTWVFW